MNSPHFRDRTLALALIPSFSAFAAVSFLIGFFTVTPQIILPLVADLAPPAKRGLAISYTTSGLLLGMLVARIIAGLIAEFSSWRIVYYTSFGLQSFLLILLYFLLPDIPPADKEETFIGILTTMAILLKTHPLLVQCSLIGALTSSAFTSYWTTLAFLLSSPPYQFSTVIIGLFALLGAGAILIGPILGRHIIDRFIPYLSTLIGLLVISLAQVLGTTLGPIHVAGPILQAFILDIGQQITMNANRVAIYGLDGKKRARLNSVYMIFAFVSILLLLVLTLASLIDLVFSWDKRWVRVSVQSYTPGTITEPPQVMFVVDLFFFAPDRGGWRASSGAATGFVGLALIVWASRGPWSKRWVGWDGGQSLRRKKVEQGAVEPNRTPVEETPSMAHDELRTDLEPGRVE